jgi:uncharacterized paraquat-inducible protein A
MDTSFNCPECNTPLKCDAGMAGTALACPKCKATITVPPPAPPTGTALPPAFVRKIYRHGLEGTLRYIGVGFLVGAVMAILGLLMNEKANVENIFYLISTGVAIMTLFFWMSEMLVIAKKIAGLNYMPIITHDGLTYECGNCQMIMMQREKFCPNCKSQLFETPSLFKF